MLKDKIAADFLVAYKAKDMIKKNFLGTLKGAIETETGKISGDITEEAVLAIIKKFDKNVKENIAMRKQSGLPTDEQELELSFLAPYLPQMMSLEQITEKVKVIIMTGDAKNVGQVIGQFNKENKGIAFDNNEVKQVVMENFK